MRTARAKARWITWAALLSAAGWLQACGHAGAPSRSAALAKAAAPEQGWQTTLGREHVLVGRIWDCRRRTYVDAGTVLRRLGEARVVLLGEKHDNPDHHLLQAVALGAVASGSRRPAVLFEMFDTTQQPAIDRYLADPSTRPEDLGKATDWPSSGWPPFERYLPIVRVAFDKHLRIVAANLPRSQVHAVVHEGPRALQAGTAVLVEQALPPPLEASLEDELRASHCGQLPNEMVGPMALAQRARDAVMARAALDADQGDGAVLIAGAGHVRLDRGVPLYLARQRPDASVASVAFVEVAADVTEPSAYAQSFGATDLPFDFVWFTPRATDADPCAGFVRPRPR